MLWGIAAVYVILRVLSGARAFSKGRGGRYLVNRAAHRALAKGMRRL